jgi:uncharacterized protein (TIGR02466 family)
MTTIFRMDGVPFWKNNIDNYELIKDSVIEKIHQLEKNKETEKLSNINGYQSYPTIYDIEEFRLLFEYVMKLAATASIDMKFLPCNLILKNAWFNINRGTNSYNKEHVHGDVFSGVLYIKCPEGSGGIEFKNPAFNEMWMGRPYMPPGENSPFHSEYFINPKEGEVFLWPSYLPHSVRSNSTDIERISISFNISATINN